MIWLAQIIILNIFALTGAFLSNILTPEDGADNPAYIPNVWRQWDAGYYTEIAKEGYQVDTRDDLTGYFPLYPLVIATINRVTGIQIPLVGYVISLGCWLVALLKFYELAYLLKPDAKYAMRATLLLAFFPTSFFFHAIYAEAMFLMFSIIATKAIFQRRWITAGVFIGLATATRPVGWLWGVLFLVEFIQAHNWSLKAIGRFLLAGAIAVSGLALYMIYLWKVTGSPTTFLTSMSAWGRHWEIPVMPLIEGIVNILRVDTLRSDWFLYVVNGYDTFFTLIGVVVTLFSYRILRRWSITLFMAAAYIFLLSSHGPTALNSLWGMARWIPQFFTIFLVLAALNWRPLLLRAVLVLSSLWMIAFTAWWASERWVA